jgi:hypothetical protein
LRTLEDAVGARPENVGVRTEAAAHKGGAMAWLAARTPRSVNADHLSLLGLAAALLAGLACLLCRWDASMLHVVNVALLFLVAYYVLAINVYLATYTLGVFRISFGVLGATELRVILAAANVGVWLVPGIQVLGLRVLMFDIAGVLCTAGLLGIAVKATSENTVRLYRIERLPTA